MSDFITYLNEILEYSTKTKGELASELGINRTTLSKYLSGQRFMSKDVFFHLLEMLHLTAIQKKKLGELFNKEICGDYWNDFCYTKESLTNYGTITYLEKFSSMYNKMATKVIYKPVKDGYYKNRILITNIIKHVINIETQAESPLIYFYFNFQSYELVDFLEQNYMVYRDKIDMKGHIFFSMKKSDRHNNFMKLMRMVPLMFSGYNVYCSFFETDSESQTVLYPYYIITGTYVVLISNDFNSALVQSDKNVISAYIGRFRESINSCDSFKCREISSFETPNIVCSLMQEQAKQYYMNCINGAFCVAPFLTAEHYNYIFNDLDISDEEKNNIITLSLSSYNYFLQNPKTIICSPTEALIEFVKTGEESPITDTFGKPLRLDDRIYLLEKVRAFIENGGKYCLYNGAEFPHNHMNINLFSDYDIVFYYNDKKKNNGNFFLLSVPNGLLEELSDFIAYFQKTSYVLTLEQSIAEIDKAIAYGLELKNSEDSGN